MDKQTLSHYGWIVVVILIICVLLGTATPFGQLFGANIKSNVATFENNSSDVLDEAFGNVPSVEDLQEKYHFDYYSSLSLAITDLNNSTRDNADVNKDTAVAGIYTNKEGVDSVVLLKDTTESNAMTVSKNSIINLGGNKLELTSNGALLKFNNGVSATLDGSLPGSSIVKNLNGTVAYLVRNYGESLTINGGEYIISGSYINGSSSATCMAINQNKVANTLILNNCKISATNNATGSKCYAYGVQSYGTNVEINNCNITSKLASGNTTYGVFNHADIKVNNTTVRASAGGGIVYGFLTTNACEANNSKFYADSINNETSGGNYGKAFDASRTTSNDGIFKDVVLNKVEAVGTHSGVSFGPGFNSYITNSNLASCSHGGIYYTNGPASSFDAGENYVSNTTLKYIPVEDFVSEYDTSAFFDGNRSAFYIGGGTGENNCNISVHMDSCKLISDTYSGTLRGTDGEVNNKLYISNSTISSGTKLRLDAGAHCIYIGKGNKFTESNVYYHNPASGKTSTVIKTNDVYTK